MNLANLKTPILIVFATLLALVVLPSSAFAAQDQTLSNQDVLFYVNNTWMLVATILVFIMHLGFAALESGLTRAKNTVNILFKNVGVLAIGILTYAVVGFNLMYPGAEFAGQVFGFGGFGVATDAAGLTSAYNPGYTYWTDFIFQAMFAATAATIVSGAVAERIKLGPFLVFSALYVAICYPIVGMWHWGGGWLAELGFYDFAGSTIVHAVGGWAALAGVIVLGPRLGKYDDDPTGDHKPNQIKGHNMPLAALGAFLLWFGWFGFNGGSVLSADPGAVSTVFVTTSFAAAAGIAGAMATSWIVQDKPDLAMVLNGALAGLVGITAGADVISPMGSVIVGAISGVIVVVFVLGIDRLKLDDPVGAISVHLVCGIWGTLAVGLFAADQALLPQLIGVAATAAFCFSTSFALFTAIKATLGLRVSEQEEIEGLDLGEHGMQAYAGFNLLPDVEEPRVPQPVLGSTSSQSPSSITPGSPFTQGIGAE
jgi:Amt family ammonium transporter